MSAFTNLETIVQSPSADPLAIAKEAIAIAERHGDDTGEPDMAFGDLEIMLAAALKLLSAEQRQSWVNSISTELALD